MPSRRLCAGGVFAVPTPYNGRARRILQPGASSYGVLCSNRAAVLELR